MLDTHETDRGAGICGKLTLATAVLTVAAGATFGAVLQTAANGNSASATGCPQQTTTQSQTPPKRSWKDRLKSVQQATSGRGQGANNSTTGSGNTQKGGQTSQTQTCTSDGQPQPATANTAVGPQTNANATGVGQTPASGAATTGSTAGLAPGGNGPFGGYNTGNMTARSGTDYYNIQWLPAISKSSGKTYTYPGTNIAEPSVWVNQEQRQYVGQDALGNDYIRLNGAQLLKVNVSQKTAAPISFDGSLQLSYVIPGDRSGVVANGIAGTMTNTNIDIEANKIQATYYPNGRDADAVSLSRASIDVNVWKDDSNGDLYRVTQNNGQYTVTKVK